MPPRTLVCAAIAAVLITRGAFAQLTTLTPPPPCRVPPGTNLSFIALDAGARDGRIVLAVLPFEREVEEVAHQHLPWAIQSHLTRRLAENHRLRVPTEGSVARASIEAGVFPDSVPGLLRAQYVLTGRVAVEQGRRAVTVALRRLGGLEPVWRAAFTAEWTLRRMEDAIVSGVERTLFRSVEESAPRPPVNEAAYEAVAAGDFYLFSNTVAAANSARESYERALQLDPRSPVAAARLARSYTAVLERGGQVPLMSNEAAMNRVLGLVTGALSADSTLAEGWTVRGVLARLRDPVSFTGATAAHARAVARAPNDADAEHEYGMTLMRSGDDRAAESHFKRALALEPSRAPTLAALSAIALRAKQWGETCRYSNASIAAWPYDPVPYAIRARARLRLAQARDAYADAETAVRLESGVWTEALHVLIEAAASNRERGRIRSLSLAGRWLRTGQVLTVRDASYLATAFVAVGDRRRAVEAIRRARPVGVDLVTALRDPALDAIRTDTTIVRLMNTAARRPKEE